MWRAYLFCGSRKNTSSILPTGSVVYIADKHTWPGGLVDRLKGLISLYDYSQQNNVSFYIFLDKKYNFNYFLKIKKKNIILNTLNRDLRKNKVNYFLDNTLIKNYNNCFAKNKINHVYTNLDLLQYQYGKSANQKWKEHFSNLFTPSDKIRTKVSEIIQNKKFIVFAFRFRSKMGDFEDDGRQWDDRTKRVEVEKLNESVIEIITSFPKHMIYIASDSTTYLKQLIKLDSQRFFYNPISKADMNDMERSIIEFLIISKGEKVFQFKRPSMYSGAFSRYASIIGNIDYKLVKV